MNSGRRFAWLCLALLLLLGGCHCGKRPTPPATPPPAVTEDTKDVAGILEFAVSRTAPRVLDVVLVHGLGGDKITTWQATDAPDSCWPKWLAADLPDCGVYSVDYAASPVNQVGNAMSFQDRAVNVLYRLELRNLGRDRPMLLIVHSLGGIVAKQMLRHGLTGGVEDHRKVAEQIKGILFLSTPHTGSALANFGLKVGNVIEGRTGLHVPSELLIQLRQNDPTLRDLSTWYANNHWKTIENRVLFETQDTPIALGAAVRVVDESSSNPGIPNIQLVPIDANHLSICKPPNRDHEIYLAIKDFVESYRDELIAIRKRRTGGLTINNLDIGRVNDDWNMVVRFQFDPGELPSELTVEVSSTDTFEELLSHQQIKAPGEGVVALSFPARRPPMEPKFVRLRGTWPDGMTLPGTSRPIPLSGDKGP